MRSGKSEALVLRSGFLLDAAVLRLRLGLGFSAMLPPQAAARRPASHAPMRPAFWE